MRLFMVRHGETAWNREGRLQGQRDIPLDETGLRQAELTAGRFRGFPLDAVLSSPLRRAEATGRRIFEEAECESFVTDPGFMEIHHGDWEGLTVREIAQKDASLLEEWHSCPERVRMPGPGGETLADVQRRAVSALKRAMPNSGKDALLVTHGAVLKVLICHFLDVPLSCYWRLRIPNCGVSCIEFADGMPRVALLSDVGHLREGRGNFLP